MSIQSKINQAIAIAGAGVAAMQNAQRKAEEAQKIKIKQRENRRAYINKQITKAQIEARKDLNVLSGKAYDVAAKQSDKQVAAEIRKQFKGVRGVGNL